MSEHTQGPTDMAEYQRHERRYWRFRDDPVSWWPYGLLLLLGLLALLLIGITLVSQHMQQEVETQVTQSLAGYDVTSVDADGQGVNVSVRASETDREVIEALASATRCPTWAGDLICPTRVNLTLDAPDLPAARLHDFVIERTATDVRLRGEVGSAAARQQLSNAAQQQFDVVDDALTVSTERADARDALAATAALSLLGDVARGTARWRDGALSLDALVAAEKETAIRASFTALAPPLAQGNLNLTVATSVDVCDARFSDALSAATIRFASASASIDPASNALLDQLAQIATQCPGTLFVEGHTDSQGDADANQSLSEARASAVKRSLVQRGLIATDIAARGFGEAQPVATNATAAGRAQNRRITIRTARADSGTGGE